MYLRKEKTIPVTDENMSNNGGNHLKLMRGLSTISKNPLKIVRRTPAIVIAKFIISFWGIETELIAFRRIVLIITSQTTEIV